MALRINAFRGWRPASGTAETVASVPYDVVNRAEARALADGQPNSFLHVIRPDIDLPDETDPYADVVYETAKAAFDRFRSEGVLVQDDKPAVYLYRQECELLGATVSQTGVVACCHTGDYEADIIKKHEKTRQKKEDDRTRHVLTLRANAGPVFLMHTPQPTVRTLVEGHTSAEPLERFTAPDGVTHTLWKVEEYEPYIAAFATLGAAYVADGHHRSASAARAGKELESANPSHTGDEEYNWFLCVLFDQGDLSILPYNRVVKDLHGLTADELLAKIGAIAQVTPEVDPTPRHRASFCMYLPGVSGAHASPNHWYNIQLAEGSIDFADPIASLDYVLLTDRVLTPILGIGDVRSDERIDFVGGIRGTAELKRRVDSGEMAVAFAMRPVEAEQIVAVADAGQIMPPKSTWFEPKLRSGLVVHTLD
ncbi:MAG: DUF1015 domain-containing protein [Planctomycetota bacterium]